MRYDICIHKCQEKTSVPGSHISIDVLLPWNISVTLASLWPYKVAWLNCWYTVSKKVKLKITNLVWLLLTVCSYELSWKLISEFRNYWEEHLRTQTHETLIPKVYFHYKIWQVIQKWNQHTEFTGEDSKWIPPSELNTPFHSFKWNCLLSYPVFWARFTAIHSVQVNLVIYLIKRVSIFRCIVYFWTQKFITQ
jgi:hypothetical protein